MLSRSSKEISFLPYRSLALSYFFSVYVSFVCFFLFLNSLQEEKKKACMQVEEAEARISELRLQISDLTDQIEVARRFSTRLFLFRLLSSFFS